MKSLYGKILRRALDRTFSLWQLFGFHIIPSHFYQNVPDTRLLSHELWERTSELIGVDLREEHQLELLADFSTNYKEEYSSFPLNQNQTESPYEYYVNNDFYPSIDSEILYCMIRRFRPRRVLEIGSGSTTFLAAQAIRKVQEDDPDYQGELEAIDPYPNKTVAAGFPGLTRLINAPIQSVPMSKFEELEKDDILFIDSSHVLLIGSDVQKELLEIIPRLQTGVIVHFHDIFMPAEYPKEWVLKRHRFWTEQYQLQSFLAFNSSFEVLWASSYMHMKHPKLLEQEFRRYERWPGSFWIRRTN